MTSLWRKLVSAAATMLLVVIGLAVIDVPKPAEALSGSMFDPGLIVSDSVFYDFGTMSVDDIQRFLNSKVAVCKDSDGGPACLKDYRMDTQAKAGESGRCDPLEAKTDQSAAQIIHDVAVACKINPKVLLVILQKEQGLVQAANPTAYMYRAALGYGCPDSKPEICGKGSTITGLFNQLYRGAGQLQWYGDPRGSFTYLKVGTEVSVRYYPDDNRSVKCGSRTFLLKSQATAALYYYTPYTPNEAALKNLYGSGDNCSAYGNRNFWRFYSDWFGSPIAGGFLVKTQDSDPYLIVDEKKYHISDLATVAALGPLGPLGTVSQPYFDSFTDAGEIGVIVKSSNNQKFLVAGGKRFSINSCSLASDFGVKCSDAIELTTSQLNMLPLAGPLTRLVKGTGDDRYFVDEGVIHEILDDASVDAAELELPAQSLVEAGQLQGLTWGDPIASDGTLLLNRSTSKMGLYVTGQFFELDEATARDIDFATWFRASTSSLSALGLSSVDRNVTVKPFVRDADSNFWLLTSSGKQHVSQAGHFVDEAPELSQDLLAKFPTVEKTIATPALVKNAGERFTYYVTTGQARPTVSKADRDQLARFLAQPETLTLSSAAFAQLSIGPAVLAPASIVRTKSDKQLYLINGWSRALKLSSSATVASLGIGPVRTVADTALAGYATKYSFSGLKYACGSLTYVPVNGLAMVVDDAAATHYPGRTTRMSATVCDQFNLSAKTAGFFIKDASIAKYFLIQDGKRLPISTPAAYRKLAEGLTKAYVADENLLARIPIGAAAPKTMPGATAPEPEPTPEDGSKTFVYTVVAGDTLNKIAAKYSTTVAKIVKDNSITNGNSISVGQKLTITKP
ncbi:MAG: LysM peptidoglycan-binding domain-containing protein [Microbacteriaceae bacterium]